MEVKNEVIGKIIFGTACYSSVEPIENNILSKEETNDACKAIFDIITRGCVSTKIPLRSGIYVFLGDKIVNAKYGSVECIKKEGEFPLLVIGETVYDLHITNGGKIYIM